MYSGAVPKLWSDTIETHRHHVREAIMEATARLVMERGLAGVSMSQVAEAAGIGRATLYKYFPDVQSIIDAWHGDQISAHLQQLTALVNDDERPEAQLRSVMLAYAHICAHRGRHEPELTVVLHQGTDVATAQARLAELFSGLIDRAAQAGAVRNDVPVDELATFCVTALATASALSVPDALTRLVEVIFDGMRPRDP
jgi:AcrR family transcriptional regulator